MQAKIIQVIEVSEFMPNATNMKKSYFLSDGTKLTPFDPFAPQPAEVGVWTSTDGKLYRDGVEIGQTFGAISLGTAAKDQMKAS